MLRRLGKAPARSPTKTAVSLTIPTTPTGETTVGPNSASAVWGGHVQVIPTTPSPSKGEQYNKESFDFGSYGVDETRKSLNSIKKRRRGGTPRGTNKGHRISSSPRIDKHHLFFVIPVFVLLVLLGQLNRWEFVLRTKNRRRRKQQQRLQQQQHELLQQHRQLDFAQSESNTHSEDWREEYLDDKEATLSFQMPTNFTVRDYYNNRHRHAPQWLWKYVRFHRRHILLNEITKTFALTKGTRYLKYSWCHNPSSHNQLLEPLVSFLDYLWPTSGSSNCATETDVIRNIEGLLTALYVAMLSDRVLIVEDVPATSLHPFVAENLFKWNITGYPQASTVLLSADDSVLKDNPEHHVCHVMSDTEGVELAAKHWDSSLWEMPCMTEKHKKNADGEEDTDAMSFHSLDQHYLYRWGFWALFRVQETVLDQADQLRVTNGLKIRQTTVDGNTRLSFQPYYYSSGMQSPADTSTHEEEAMQCAQKLYQASLPIAVEIQERDDTDDDAIDDDVKRPIIENVLHRSLFLGGGGTTGEIGTKQQTKAIPVHATPKETTSIISPNSLHSRGNADNMVDPDLMDDEELPPLWYRNFWSELVVSIEAECLIEPMESIQEQQQQQQHQTTPSLSSGIVPFAKLLSALHPESMKRCQVRVDECDAQYSFRSMSKLVVDTLPWAHASSTE